MKLSYVHFFCLILCFAKLNNASGICDFFTNISKNDSKISQQCVKQMNTVCNNGSLGWTMFDASSKFLISGMNYSNVIDYGNFPECLSIDHQDHDGRIIGKYCGLSMLIIDIFLINNKINEILTSFNLDVNSAKLQEVSMEKFIKMERQFPDDLLKSVVISKYSICIPDACTPEEVGYYYLYGRPIPILNSSLIVYTNITCETKYSNTELEWGDVLFVVFLSLVVIIMLLSTLYDALCQNFKRKPYHPLFLSFSVLYNGKKLLAISRNKTEQIQCFNGMRFISMMWVLAYHGASPFGAGIIALENYPEAKEWNASWTNRYIQSGLLAVDTFFFISGFLLAFAYIKSNSNKGLVNQILKVPKMYLHRYLRLTPAVGVVYLITITIFRTLGSGPTWTFVANAMKDTCKKYWWQFFLYIQNYTNPNEMCVNPTWYLSADMQMFILAPLVMIPTATYIKKYYKEVIYGLITLTFFWIFCPMFIRYFADKEAGNIYTTHERLSNFLIGITFGTVMRMKKDKPFIFSSLVNFGLWVLVIVVSLAFNIYWFDVLYYYNLEKYTLFNGFYRPVWCFCLVFMVYSCYHNQGGFAQWVLQRPSFQILGRLSYSMYVIHVLVELYAGLNVRTTFYFSNYILFYNWCGHFLVTLVLSVFWVLAFEFPMMTIDKYLLDGDWLRRRKNKLEVK